MAETDPPIKHKNARLYTVSRSVVARNVMLSTPDVALNWLLQTLAELTSESRAIMMRDNRIPDPDRPPKLILMFDVYGLPADAKENANGQDLGH